MFLPALLIFIHMLDCCNNLSSQACRPKPDFSHWKLCSAFFCLKVFSDLFPAYFSRWFLTQYACPNAGTLEDWDTAVQKTETRLNRINEQRAKVGRYNTHTVPLYLCTHCWCTVCRCIIWLCFLTSVRLQRKKPTWHAMRMTKWSSGGSPRQKRRPRRKLGRQIGVERREKPSKRIIRRTGMRNRVKIRLIILKNGLHFVS